MADTDVLWGGTLIGIEIDPVAWTLSVTVEVPTADRVVRHTLQLRELRSLQVDRATPLPWTYAELTEVHVAEMAESLRVEFVVWDDTTGLVATCAGLSMSTDQ